MRGGVDLNTEFQAARDLLRRDRADEALAAFDALLLRDPRHLPTLVTRGSALMALGRLDEAEADWRCALALSPHQPVIVWNLGTLLAEQEKHSEALELADATLAQVATHGPALLVRGEALSAMARFDEAVDAFERIPPEGELAYDALSKLGLAYAGLQRHDTALAALDRAVALKPDEPLARFRRAIVRLSIRDFGGWSDYEARWRVPVFLSRSGGVVTPDIARRLTLAPTLDDLAGKRVLLLGEQGIGDQIMFASLIPDLQRVAKAVACVCEGRLVRLLSASFPGVGFAAPADAGIAVDAVDHVVAMGSLGGVFRPDEAAFPGVAYLAPRPDIRARWAERLGPRSAPLRVGLSWRGGVPTTRRSQRSIDLDQIAPILDLPGCEVFSLQYGTVPAELEGRPIRAFAPGEIDDFEDLAAVAAEMDVVVSVQTALVHLCGAIGRDCLTLVPHNPEWRYTAHGSTMPWYQSVKIFRQATVGDWEPVVAQVAQTLRARLGASS